MEAGLIATWPPAGKQKRLMAWLKRQMYATARVNYWLQCQFMDQVFDRFGEYVVRPFGGESTGGMTIVIPLPPSSEAGC
jgi:hypothetical protein